MVSVVKSINRTKKLQTTRGFTLRAPSRTQHIVDYYVPKTSAAFDHLVNKNNIEREIRLFIFLIISLFCFDAFYSCTQKNPKC